MIDDPAKKQYFIFSAVIAFLISITLNFLFNDFLQVANSFGFPFSTEGANTITKLFIQLVNTAIMGAFLIVPIYMLLDYVNKRR